MSSSDAVLCRPLRKNQAQQPRLCLATDSREPSGVGEHMLLLAAELRGDFDIVLACAATSSGQRLRERAHRIGLRLDLFDADADPTFWLRDGNFDLLHVHAGVGWEGHWLAIAGREAGIARIVRTEHLPDVITDEDQRATHRRYTALVDQLICVSRASARSYVAAGIERRKVRVIRNGVQPLCPGRTRREVRDALGFGADQPIAFTAARFTPQKDQSTLIEAAALLRTRHADVRFMLAGDGPLLEACQRGAEKLGLNGSVKFLGLRSDVPDLLAAADIFVLPSRFEGLPLAILEAMAAGLPIVSTRVGGTNELVREGVTGLLIPPGDPPALAEAVSALLSDRSRAIAMGEAGRARFDGDFTAARMARETAQLYKC